MSEAIDRVATCPFLLRCFWKLSRHNNPSEYCHISQDSFPGNEVQLYMWQDSTLREVTEALRLVVAPALATTTISASDSKLDVSSVFMSRDGLPVMKNVACVSLEEGGVLEQLGDARRTLRQLRVRPGDLLDVAVLGGGAVVTGTAQAPGGGVQVARHGGATARSSGVVMQGGGGKGRGRKRGGRGRAGGGGGGNQEGGRRREFGHSATGGVDSGEGNNKKRRRS